MNDYKELCETLRLANEWQFASGFVKAMLEAADTIEQLVRERDAAVEAAENIHSDFADFACTGIDNLAPYCGNRCPECIDESGWCKDVTKFCKGFISVEYTEWRGLLMNENKKESILNRLLDNTVIMHDLFMRCEAEDITLADYGKFFENVVEIVAEIAGIDELERFRCKWIERVEANNSK